MVAVYIACMSQPAHDPRQPHFPLLRKALGNWLERHRLPFNFWIHMLGIPLALSSLLLFFLVPWYWGVGALVVGYLLQYIGHRAEGNDLGEWAGIKRLLGLPYVAISPRWESERVGE